MDERRLDLAMTRIEAALARIDTAARQLSPPSGGWDRYREMRGRARNSLAELDRLIAELEK